MFPQQSGNEVRMVAVSHSLPGDLETPIGAFLKLCPEGPAYLLESAAGGEQVARYSFIGYNPFLTLKAWGHDIELFWRDGSCEKRQEEPFKLLKELLEQYRADLHPPLVRFSGGAVGYFAYDVAALLEPVGKTPPDELGLPDIYLQFMQNVLVFDHFTHRLYLAAYRPLLAGETPALALEKAQAVLRQMGEMLSAPLPTMPAEAGCRQQAVTAGSMSEAEFTERVRVAKEYIRAGDIFQVVLSQRLTVPVPENPFAVYRRLRSLNPSPYMFFLRHPEVTLVGASPEMLVRVEGRTVTTRPIAGTRRRGGNAEEDQQLALELLADEKEMAEHVMLVDLGRNDIGRVARYGTVQVKEYARVERYSHVMHLVSEVVGELADGKDAFDALAACFPAGTLTGAPKVRAMQIINELETVRRGPYGGAVGYLDFSGNMDTCITIRTLVIKDGTAFIQTGAGIVADSVPENEYRETRHKARAMLAALGVETK